MAVKTAIRFVYDPLIEEIVTLEPVSDVVLSKVRPPLEGVAHFKPVEAVLSATSIWSLDPTARRATVDAAVALIRSPLAVRSVG
jgi:hypothetical protein